MAEGSSTVPLPRGLARINRTVTNRIAGPFAGRVPGFAIVVHRGRKSGREYRTPVNVFADETGYKIALTYGRESDWLKNILADGGCVLERRGTAVPVSVPTVHHDPSARWAPMVVRQMLTALDAPYYVHLTFTP